MAKYYGLISGLPDLSPEMQKLVQTQEEFYLDALDVLSSKDRELLEWLRLEACHRPLLTLYEDGHLSPSDLDEAEALEQDLEIAQSLEHKTTLPVALLRRIARAAHQGNPVRRCEELPGYIVRFINELFSPAREEQDEPMGATNSEGLSISLEDRLSGLYYGAASRSRNDFVASWFRFNQTLRNVLVIHTCRRLGWSVDQYLVGDSEIEIQLRTSRARDFDLSEQEPLISNMVQIAEETDITRRERMIDALRWRWLEEVTFARVFDIESVLTYYIRLGIIERWLRLNAETGEQTFRDIVHGLKRESNASLQEFKKNNSKR